MWHFKRRFKSRQSLSSVWHGSCCIHCNPLSLRMRFCVHITQNIILKSSQTKAEDMKVEIRMKSPQNHSARSGEINKAEKRMRAYRKKKKKKRNEKKLWVINTELSMLKGKQENTEMRARVVARSNYLFLYVLMEAVLGHPSQQLCHNTKSIRLPSLLF